MFESRPLTNSLKRIIRNFIGSGNQIFVTGFVSILISSWIRRLGLLTKFGSVIAWCCSFRQIEGRAGEGCRVYSATSSVDFFRRFPIALLRVDFSNEKRTRFGPDRRFSRRPTPDAPLLTNVTSRSRPIEPRVEVSEGYQLPLRFDGPTALGKR